MSDYNFDIKLETVKYTIEIDTSEKYGYFEHKELGEERAGGLWFNDEMNELLDYDGVSELPKQVLNELNKAGYVQDKHLNNF